MRFSYVHDANGGNSVKSRAARNEIHYNWIEGALYHELDLIGAELYAERRWCARTPRWWATCCVKTATSRAASRASAATAPARRTGATASRTTR